MDEQKIKKELINKTLLDLTVKGEILKSLDLINSYEVDCTIENLSIARDGVLEYDVHIHQKIAPKVPIENIVIDFKILPNSDF